MYAESPRLAERASSDGVHRQTPNTYYRSSGLKSAPFVRTRPSTTRRIFRALARFSVVVLIGVLGTLAWQSYGIEMVRTRAPSLDWLLPAAPSGPAVTSAELQVELKLAAFDLAIVRRNVEQLTTNQDQLARKVDELAQAMTTVQSAEQDISQEISGLAPIAPKVRMPPPKSLQSRAQ